MPVVSGDDEEPVRWQVSGLQKGALVVTERMNDRGYFVNDGQQVYYFDQADRLLIVVDSDDPTLKDLLYERFQVNRKDSFYPFLIEHVSTEARLRGETAVVRKFSYYDPDADAVLLDMGGGSVLRITTDSILPRLNGQDGVLFTPLADYRPWKYNPQAEKDMIFRTLIEGVNFNEDGGFTVEDEQTLLLLWMVSLAYESMMRTRPIMLAVGPSQSGKSSMFRYIGQLLFGSTFQVDTLNQDQKGEEAFWGNVTDSPFLVYDNVDQYVRWLPDALAQISTGVRRSVRVLHTTNEVRHYPVRCILALTARTPTYSLRREDVASRTLVLTMKPLAHVIDEYEIEDNIARNRDTLMSDCARLVQQSLQAIWDDVTVPDPGMRLADFARIAMRAAAGMGITKAATSAMAKIRGTQFTFATEEDAMSPVLAVWIEQAAPKVEGQMDIETVYNNGADLYEELQALAKRHHYDLQVSSPEGLGKSLKNMHQALLQTYDIESGRGRVGKRRGSWWRLSIRDDVIQDSDDDKDADDE